MKDGIDLSSDFVEPRVNPLLEPVEPSILRIEAPRGGIELAIDRRRWNSSKMAMVRGCSDIGGMLLLSVRRTTSDVGEEGGW
jgi:hypothetical protein